MLGKLIVIEGADGVGKETQTNLLREHLEKSGKVQGNVLTWSFPDYTSPWGQLVRQYLNGESPFHLDPGYATILLAADRSLATPKLRAELEAGNWILCDRFLFSNAAFQGTLFPTIEKRNEYFTWLEWLEYKHFNLPHPDATILLTLPSEVIHSRTEERRQTAASNKAHTAKVSHRDIHEENKDFMTNVSQEYLRLGNLHGWNIIECADSSTGEQFSREVVHKKVWDTVSKTFSL